MSMLVEILIEFAVVAAIVVVATQVAACRRFTARKPRVAEVDSAYDVTQQHTAFNYTTNPVFHGWGTNVFGDNFEDRHL